jgi:hypothetical protein
MKETSEIVAAELGVMTSRRIALQSLDHTQIVLLMEERQREARANLISRVQVE